MLPVSNLTVLPSCASCSVLGWYLSDCVCLADTRKGFKPPCFVSLSTAPQKSRQCLHAKQVLNKVYLTVMRTENKSLRFMCEKVTVKNGLYGLQS